MPQKKKASVKRRPRSDSAEMQSAMLNARPPALPEHIKLRTQDVPYWDSIISARDLSSWTLPELDHAANLARCKADIERIQGEIHKEGDTIINQRGTPIVNPKHSLMETLTRRSIALTRLLMVHAQATVGETHEVRKRNQAQRDVQQKHATVDAEDEELFARPKH